MLANGILNSSWFWQTWKRNKSSLSGFLNSFCLQKNFLSFWFGFSGWHEFQLLIYLNFVVHPQNWFSCRNFGGLIRKSHFKLSIHIALILNVVFKQQSHKSPFELGGLSIHRSMTYTNLMTCPRWSRPPLLKTVLIPCSYCSRHKKHVVQCGLCVCKDYPKLISVIHTTITYKIFYEWILDYFDTELCCHYNGS